MVLYLRILKSHSPPTPGSRGVTLTIIPHLAYVDLPKQTTRVSLGILKFSTVRAKAKELGGIIQTSPLKSTKFLSIKAFVDRLLKSLYL